MKMGLDGSEIESLKEYIEVNQITVRYPHEFLKKWNRQQFIKNSSSKIIEGFNKVEDIEDDE